MANVTKGTLVKCNVKFLNRNFKISLNPSATVGHLMIKLRRYLKIRPEEAVFIFFVVGCLGNNRLYGISRLLSDIKRESGYDVLPVILLKENAFGNICGIDPL